MSLVYLDTETTGLDPALHEIVEVAWAADDGPITTVALPHTLRNADPKALDINGYWDRDLDNLALLPAGKLPPLRPKENELLRALRGATIVGSNPAFDAAFLRARYGLAHWHHRLYDLSAYAAGVLGWTELRGMAAIRDDLYVRGFEIPEPDHTAAGDVETLRACHRVLLDLAATSGRYES